MTERATSQDSNPLRGHAFINLETFRKSGLGVRTPVWFADANGGLFVRTQHDSGKVKRIRRDGRVRLAPSDAAGSPRGSWLDGQARLAGPEESALAEQLFRKKYGLQYLAFEAMMRLRRGRWATLSIALADQPGRERSVP